MSNTSSSKKHGLDQPEISGPTPKSQRSKMIKAEDSEKRVTVRCTIRIQMITHFPNHQNLGTQNLQKLLFENSLESQCQTCFQFALG